MNALTLSSYLFHVHPQLIWFPTVDLSHAGDVIFGWVSSSNDSPDIKLRCGSFHTNQLTHDDPER